MAKKILLAGPFTRGSIFQTRFVSPPLGVHYIASFLNAAGHEAVVYDCNDPDYEGRTFESVLESNKWDIVSFSDLDATIEYTLTKIWNAKKICPDALLVAGGTGPSLNYQTYFQKSPLDIVVLAEGEYPMLDLCNDKPWQDIDGIVFRKYSKQLTQNDYTQIRTNIDIEKMHTDKYWKKTAEMYPDPDLNVINTFRLHTMNFCPMGCNFCTLTHLRKYACGKTGKVLALNGEQVVTLMERILKTYPDCKTIYMTDDDTFFLPGRDDDLCYHILDAKKRGTLPNDLGFICVTNINRLNEDNLELMAKAGIKILSIGIESTSKDVLNSYNKKQTPEQIFRVVDMIIKHGIKPYLTAIMFSPYGRIQDLMIDLEGFRRLANMGAGLSIEQRLIPLHGTEFAERGLQQRMREVKVGDNGLSIHKGFAWLPQDPEVLRVFEEFERIYPKFRKWRIDTVENKHFEKNLQAHSILDCLEFVLRERFGYKVKNSKLLPSDIVKIELALITYKDMDIDVVGTLIEKEDLH